MFSRLLLLVPVTILACVTPAQAQTYVWNGPLTGTTNWSAGLWSPGTPPSGGGTGVALFFTGTNGSYVATNNLGNPFVLNSMEFGQRFTASTSISGSVPSSIQLGGADPFIGIPVVGAIEANGNSVSISSSISLNASSGTATLGSQGKGVLLIAGNISGTGPVSLVGNNNAVNWSYLRLAGSNSFIGGVTLDGGHVILGSSSALGAAANTLTVNSGWISSTVSSLTIGNAVTLNGDLQFMGTGANLIMTGLLSGNGGVRVSGLTSGTTVLDVRATNTYSGQTVIDTAPIFGQSTNSPVNNGSLNVATATGSLLNTSGVIVRSGTLFLNDSAASTVTGGRINDAASITLGSGVLNVLIGSSGSYNEVVDGLILESGHSSVSLTPQPSTAAQLSFSTLTRQNRATALFRGASLGNTPGANVATVSFSTPPVADLIGGGGAAGTTTISILPYAYGHTTSSGLGNSLVTLTSGRIRPLVFATEYAGTMVGGTSSTENVRLTSNFNLSTASLTVRNSLTLNSGTLSNSGGGALRLTSGTILFTLSSTISAPLDFGSQEAIILSSAASTISGSIAGSGGLTKGGPANLTLSGVNSYSGTTTINGGLILFSSPTAFGNSNLIQAGGANADLTTIDRAGLTYTGATAAVLPQDIVLRSGLFALNATNANGSLRLDGQVSGSGGLFINTTGNVILTNNNNNYTGQTRIF
ncbi:MAG TPA: hypothetical protein PKC45_01405, partial [Gemmatales bacterium]|nr:hypothetical protein [Gemmatales bacterium]